MILSILIPTTVDRREMFFTLHAELFRQAFKWREHVEILYLEDNKEISVGAKRQKLLEMAKGKYVVGFDSDDFPFSHYLDDIMLVLGSEDVDCIGFEIHMTTNGQHEQTCCHSRRYREWAKNVDGYDYVRNVTQFNPVKRELALQVGFKDMRYGEDKDYADRLTPLCKTEAFLKKKLFHYRYTKQDHKERYGIK